MARSFGLVEGKLRETEFFLDKLRETERFSFGSDFYFSAFVSAARSVTLAMQASLNDTPNFREWYESARQRLKTDGLAIFFVQVRNDVVHTGANPLNRISLDHLREDVARQLQGDKTHVLVLPGTGQHERGDLVGAVELCEEYFKSLVSVVYDCYSNFRTTVDGRWYFTEDNFKKSGKNFHDAVAELGFPPNWVAGVAMDNNAWRAVRSLQPPCLVNDLFYKLLGKTIPDPDDPLSATAPSV